MSRILKHRFVSTFSNQGVLPRLPIPTLANLEVKYLASVEPLLTTIQHQKSTEIVKAFVSPEGLGPILQKRLIDHDRTKKESWLEDFWLTKAYLEYRAPTPINVNYWCEFIDHPLQPKEFLINPPPRGVLTAFQITRAAGLISNYLNFNDMLNSGTFEAEVGRTAPLCMNQYKKIFGTSRVPGATCDSLKHQYPTTSNHIIVMVRGQMYKMQVYGENMARVSLLELERLLLAVGKTSLEVLEDKRPEIGYLTAGSRDTWFEAYSSMKQLSSVNSDNFDTIQQALFTVCLDDVGVRKNKDQSHVRIFHNNAKNRWFDSSIQLIISSSGRAGLNGEHTSADAVVPGKVTEFVLKNEPAVDPLKSDAELRLPLPEILNFKVNERITELISKATIEAKQNIDDNESVVLHSDVYGSRYMKEVALTSPDAYIQMALQLTYYRIAKQVTAVYETASTRFFLHGRTETVRSMSSESAAFCKSFDDDEVLFAIKRDLFKKAIVSQSNFMKSASMGKGIDRHMLGLRCMMKEGEDNSFFSDLAYSKSSDFKLSTSNMSPGKLFYGGFGPVSPKGYGINYAIDKDSLKFSISSKKSSKLSASYKFREMLEKTLVDMFILFPKRTEVWGIGWDKRFKEEAKDEYKVSVMMKLSDDIMKKQSDLAKRYL